jgi:hypothetical protein
MILVRVALLIGLIIFFTCIIWGSMVLSSRAERRKAARLAEGAAANPTAVGDTPTQGGVVSE